MLLVGGEWEADEIPPRHGHSGSPRTLKRVDPPLSFNPRRYPEATLPIEDQPLRSFEGPPVRFCIAKAVDAVNDVLVGGGWRGGGGPGPAGGECAAREGTPSSAHGGR